MRDRSEGIQMLSDNILGLVEVIISKRLLSVNHSMLGLAQRWGKEWPFQSAFADVVWKGPQAERQLV